MDYASDDNFVGLRVIRFSNVNATQVSDGPDFSPGNRLPALSHYAHRRLPLSFRCRPRSDQCILDNIEYTENVILLTRVGEPHRREDLPWTSVPCPPTSSACRVVPRPPPDAQDHCREHALCRTRGPR